MFPLASHVVQLSSNFSGSKSFYFSSSFDGEFSSSLVQVTSDGFLLMAMASILLSSSAKI